MKKIISVFICIQLALFPTFLFAGNVGGWNLSNPVSKGASVIYDASKNVVINGKNYVKDSWVKITPTATSVAKVLARGGAGYALSVAVEQLIGSVDWVLDPANNRIKYYDEVDPKTLDKVWYYNTGGVNYLIGSTIESVCNQIRILENRGSYTGYTQSNPTTVRCRYNDAYGTRPIYYGSNPLYDPTIEQEPKTLPLDVVAAQVISNAEEGDTNAQAATTAAAADIVAEAETDNAKARPIASQAEANAETKPADAAEADKANEATGEAKPNTSNPEATDLSIEFPVFCGWAPIVCEAAQTVISFPTTLTDWWETSNSKADGWASSISEAWTSVKDWATDAPDLQQQEQDLPIDEKPLERDPSSFDTSYVTFGNQCPVFDSYEVSVGPISKTLSMDLTPLCQFAEKVRPAVLGMSYLGAAGIVLAAIRES